MVDETQEMQSVEKEAEPSGSNGKKAWGMEVNVFAMLMHLSLLSGFIIPFGGLILPIVMWATNKDDHEEINLHGLILFNWMISGFIYFVVSFILSFIGIGVLLMIALGICSIVFAIMGGIKANEGKYWPYPLSIDFFGVKKRLPAAE